MSSEPQCIETARRLTTHDADCDIDRVAAFVWMLQPLSAVTSVGGLDNARPPTLRAKRAPRTQQCCWLKRSDFAALDGRQDVAPVSAPRTGWLAYLLTLQTTHPDHPHTYVYTRRPNEK